MGGCAAWQCSEAAAGLCHAPNHLDRSIQFHSTKADVMAKIIETKRGDCELPEAPEPEAPSRHGTCGPRFGWPRVNYSGAWASSYAPLSRSEK